MENVSLKSILVTQKKQGLQFAQEYLRIFLLIAKTTVIFYQEKKSCIAKTVQDGGYDTACMTARENDKVYYNGQRCGGFIDKKEDEFKEILQFWKSQGWYERAKIDRMLDEFEKFYAEIEEI